MSESGQQDANVVSIGTVDEVLSIVMEMFGEFASGDQSVTADTNIMSDLDIDSVAVMDLVMELEDRFDVSIPLDVIPNIRTVGDLTSEIHTIRRGGK